MELALILSKQVLTMFILMAVGVVIVKTKLVEVSGVKNLTNVLLYLVSPALLISTYQTAFDAIKLKGLMLALVFSVISHVVSIFMNRWLLRKGAIDKAGVEEFATVYTNSGFIGIPLIEASFGSEGVFYCTAYLTVFNVLMWTHGVYILKKGEKGSISLKSIFMNPGVIGCAVGFLLYVLQITLPSVVGNAVRYLGNMNTPLALLISGILLANTDLKALLKNKRLFYVSFLRIILTPLVVLGLFLLMRVNTWHANAGFIAVLCMISTACPTGQAAGFFATRCGADGEYGGQIMTLTTLCCIVTLPLIASLAAALLM